MDRKQTEREGEGDVIVENGSDRPHHRRTIERQKEEAIDGDKRIQQKKETATTE